MKRKNRKIEVIAALSALVIACAAPADAANILLNSDLELGTLGRFADSVVSWTEGGVNGWYHDEFNHTPGGSRCVKFGGPSSAGNISQGVWVVGGESYTLSAFAYSSSAEPVDGWRGNVYLDWRNAAGQKTGSNSVVSTYFTSSDPLDQWKLLSQTFTAPADAARVYVVASLNDANGATNPNSGTIGFDDITLDGIAGTQPVVPEPASMLLLGAGLFGLSVNSKRKLNR